MGHSLTWSGAFVDSHDKECVPGFPDKVKASTGASVGLKVSFGFKCILYRNLIKKPLVSGRVLHRDPMILGIPSQGVLNQVPTLIRRMVFDSEGCGDQGLELSSCRSHLVLVAVDCWTVVDSVGLGWLACLIWSGMEFVICNPWGT